MHKKHNITFLFDSNPNSGAVNRSALGSTFTIDFDTPLIIPKNASNINVKIINATVWFVTPNVTTDNNIFVIFYNGVRYAIAIPTGLYNTTTLSNKIATQLHLINPNLPRDLIELQEDTAESKVIIKFNYYNIIIDFTVPNSINEILGFNAEVITGYTDALDGPLPFYLIGDNVAQFNQTSYYLIKCSSLLNRGLYINGKYRGVLAKIDVDVDVNSKIIYDPNQTALIPAEEIKGIDLSSLTFQLTDQNDELVDTRGEDFSITFEIQYDLPPQNYERPVHLN